MILRAQIFILIFLTGLVNLCYAQEDKLSAKEYYDMGFYKDALNEYLKEFKKNPGDYNIHRRIGACYLQLNDDRSKAIDYLEFAWKNDRKHCTGEFLLDIANAYRYGYRFEEAIEKFKEFRVATNPKNYEYIDREIEMCENAKELIKSPIDISFINLGKEVNSTEADYYPFVNKDESYLVFTSRRKGSTGNMLGYQGYYTSDIYYSKVVDGKWVKAKGISPTINTIEDEQCVGLSSNGMELLIYEENGETIGDIFICENTTGKGFSKTKAIYGMVNSDDMETEAFVNNEATTIYFTSNRPGGYGGYDLYMSHVLPDGNWAQPTNLGPSVNSKYDEGFPRITEDEKTLYFCSKGHKSMGGYDIFVSKWDEEKQTWNEPKNIGFPLNTPEDNMCYSLCANERDAYISSWRKEGMGDIDIWKVVFNTVEQKQTALKVKVLINDSTVEKIEANVLIESKKLDKPISKKVNPKTGKVIVSLGPGIYDITVKSEGYEEVKETVKILDMSDYKSVIEKKIELVKPPSPETEKKKTVKKAPAKKGN